jgi:hypothetical protein
MNLDPSLEPAPTHGRQRRAIDRHFRGHSSPAGEREMRAHLDGCPDCRAHYDRHLLLAAADPAALPARDRLARGLGLSVRRPSPAPWFAALAAAAVGVAALVLLVPRATLGPQPRGTTGPRHGQLLVYEVPRQGTPRQVGAAIDRTSGLAFAYANLGHRRRLSVFAVDDVAHVYWFYPAWQDPNRDPAGVDIADDDGVHEIPEAIYHRFDGSRLRVYGVFADGSLGVHTVEAAIAGAPGDEQRRLEQALPDAEVARLDVGLEGTP